MNKILILIFIITFNYSELSAQCQHESGVFDCAENLLTKNAVYLSDFPADVQLTKNLLYNNGLTWDIYLNKNTYYRFALCSYTGLNNIVMKLYDNEQDEMEPYGSTFTEGKDYETFDYKCQKSGFYKVSIRFKEGRGIGQNLCAIGLMGYVGQIRK